MFTDKVLFMNDNFPRNAKRAGIGPWAMRLQLIGGSYLVCLPKTWVKENVALNTNLMILDINEQNDLVIKPMKRKDHV